MRTRCFFTKYDLLKLEKHYVALASPPKTTCPRCRSPSEVEDQGSR
jgi:hypothetical protein